MNGLRDSENNPLEEGFFYEGSMENQCFVLEVEQGRVEIRRHYSAPKNLLLSGVLSPEISRNLTPIHDLSYVAARITNFSTEVSRLSEFQRGLSQDLSEFLTLSKQIKATHDPENGR